MSLLVAAILLALATDTASTGWAIVLGLAAFVVATAGLIDHLLERGR